jgi:group I intron endonuclease
MEFIYNGNSLKSGVYKITNKINNKIYIGSCKEFKERARDHFSSLKKNRHHNKHLQSSFNKNGSDAFIFEVLEVIDGDKILRTTREKELLDEQIQLNNWQNCFNFHKNPIAAEKSCYSKNPEETRKKQSIAHMGNKNMLGKKVSQETIEKRVSKTRGQKRTDEFKKRLSIAHTGKILSKETKEKLSIITKNQWKDPDYRNKNVESRRGRHLTEEHKYNLSLAGKNKIISEEQKKKISIKNSLPIIGYDIMNKKQEKFISIKEASEKTGICYMQIIRILKGKSKNPRKWKFVYSK